MALMPAMPMTEPTEEEIAFDERVREWLMALDLLSQCVGAIPRVKTLQGEAEQMSAQIGRSKEALMQRCQWLGRWYSRAKDVVKACRGHGHWEEWLKEHSLAPRTAQLFVAIAENPELLVAASYDLSKVRVKKTQGLAVSSERQDGDSGPSLEQLLSQSPEAVLQLPSEGEEGALLLDKLSLLLGKMEANPEKYPGLGARLEELSQRGLKVSKMLPQ